jgi:hypothetical protein
MTKEEADKSGNYKIPEIKQEIEIKKRRYRPGGVK